MANAEFIPCTMTAFAEDSGQDAISTGVSSLLSNSGNGQGRADEQGHFSSRALHLLTIACLVGTEAQLELEWHIRLALRDGCPVGEIKQLLRLLATYCETPKAVSVLETVREVVDQWEDKSQQA